MTPTATETLRFSPADHRYFLDPAGERIPGATELLTECGMIDWSMVAKHVVEAAGLYGSQAHDATHAEDDGDLDDEALDPDLRINVIEPYRVFKRVTGFEPDLVEYMGFHPVYRYAGRVDRRGSVRAAGGRPGGRDRVVLDFKTGVILPAYRLKLAAYTAFFPDPQSYRRIDLQFPGNGTYKVHEYDQAAYNADLSDFLHGVAVWWWKREHGRGKR
jgi:hypothetical protein